MFKFLQRRFLHHLPVIKPPAVASQGDVQNNLRLFDEVRAKRDSVSARDNAVSSTPREGRKLTTRERIDLIKDEGTEILKIGPLAGLGMSYGDVMNGSMEVSIATVCGQYCMVSGNDWTFKGGTIYPIGVKKQLRGQEIARENNLPCIYIADSGGAFLPLQSGLYPDKEHGGRVFRNQAVLSSLGIPQVALVVGPCTAGGAYIPAMSDEAVIVQDVGTLYLAGPPLVKAATGASLTAEELGGAKVHCTISGCTDHYALTEEEGISTIRDIVSSLNLKEQQRSVAVVEDPLYAGSDEEFAKLLPAQTDHWPMMEIIARLVDGSKLRQFKEQFGTNLCTGFARLNGHLIGVVANTGSLGASEGIKASHFIRVAGLRGVPLLFLVNTPSDKDFLAAHGSDGHTAKARAQMMSAIVSATVPKITVVLGSAYGPSYYAMCGRPLSPNFLFHWPHARCGIAEPSHMIDMWEDKDANTEQLLSQLSMEESSMCTSDLCNDGVILPSETRKVLSQCLDIATKYSSHSPPQNLNVLRM